MPFFKKKPQELKEPEGGLKLLERAASNAIRLFKHEHNIDIQSLPHTGLKWLVNPFTYTGLLQRHHLRLCVAPQGPSLIGMPVVPICEVPEGVLRLSLTTDVRFEPEKCPHDTNSDGDCHLCHNRGGCRWPQMPAVQSQTHP
jgi:hypothetical protein